MKRSYILVDPKKKTAVRALDTVGDLILSRKASQIGMRGFKNILIVSLDLLGDNVFATPVPRALKEKYSGSRVTVLANESFVDVFADNPFVDEVIPFNVPWFPRGKRRTSLYEIWHLVKELRSREFDLGIDLRGDLRHNLILYLAGIPARLGYGVAGGGFFLTNEVEYPWELHEVEKKVAVLGPLGIEPGAVQTEIFPSAELKAFIFDELGFDGTSAVIGIHPSASAQAKRWPVERFAAVGDYCVSELGAEVIITGSDSDRQTAEEMKSMMKFRPKTFIGKSLGDLVALLSRLDLFVAGDTGPLHVAIAAGTAAIAIYSANYDPSIWSPYRGNHILIREDVSCALCYQTECEDHICMEAITVDEVALKVKEALGAVVRE